MKRHLFLKSLLIAIGLLVTSLTTQVWATMANLIEGSYIYLNVTNDSRWADEKIKFNWYKSDGTTFITYTIAEYVTTNVWACQVPCDGCGGIQIIRVSNDLKTQGHYTAVKLTNARTYDSENCLWVGSGSYNGDNSVLSWGTYYPYAYVDDGGDGTKVAQVMTHSQGCSSTKTFVHSFKNWGGVDEKEFGEWESATSEITKTNGVYAFYVSEDRKFIVHGYTANSCNTKSYNPSDGEGLYATHNPSQDHHRGEKTYLWNGTEKANYDWTGMTIKITSSAYELYIGETATFSISVESPLTDLVGLEIWENGEKLSGTPSGSGTSRTFTFTATTPGIRTISARIHFTFNGHDIYLCAKEMKIRVYEKYKIKVQNTLDWDALKLHMFRSADNAIKNAAWPGVLVEEKIANDGEHDWYFVELDSKFDRFILANSNASKQTYSAGMSYDKATYEDKCYYMEGKSNTNNWTTEMDCPEFYRIKSVCAGGTYYSNILMNEGKFSMYATTAGTLTLQHLVGATWTDMTSTITRTGITMDAVYVADFNGSNTTNNFVIYDGDYYIHCNASTKNYLDHGESKGGVGTKFTHFSKSAIFKDTYDYYWVDWFNGSETVIATIGNDYNDNLAVKLGSDAYAPSGTTVGKGGNVRFSYDSQTNTFTRSILSSGGSLVKISSFGADSVMVINESTGKYTEDATTPQSFDDATNWVYTLDAEVRGTAHATVTSEYNSVSYTLSDKAQLLGGSTETKYEVEISYDFKTNRVLGAWMPKTGEEITGFDLQSNLMVVRREDQTPTILNITGADNKVTGISKIYTTFEIWQSSWLDDVNEPYANRRITSGNYIDEFYWFSLPYKCYMGDVFGIEGYGPNGSWVIMTYHGDYRARDGWWAETDNWWYYLDRTDTLYANQGYVLRVTNLNGENSESTGIKSVFPEDTDPKLYLYFPSYDEGLSIKEIGSSTTTTVPEHICTKVRDEANHAGDPNYDRRAIDSNWNIIGSPSFNTATLKNTDFSTATYPTSNVTGTLKYFFTWSAAKAGTNKYTIQDAADYQFKALSAYLVQYAGTINWQAGTGTNPLVGVFKAPTQNQEESGEQKLRLVLNQDGQQADVAFISRMEEGATEDYDLNMDLSKLMNAKQANIYTISGFYKMAGNCIPDTETALKVGVQLASDGEYTFTMPDGTYGTGVTLIDKVTNSRTNLALTGYTVNLTAGTYDERFELELSPIKQMPTGVELLNGENLANGVRKVMVDGILYIVKDGKAFDAQGNRVK